MPSPTQQKVSAETLELEHVANLLGGSQVLGCPLKSTLDAHMMLTRGLPGQALSHLLGRLIVIRPNTSLEKAVGMSLRTFQRRKGAPDKLLNRDQSGRTWKFAEILAKATEVLGSQEDAEQWLESPAIGLNRHRPIDLLETPAGVELVEAFLKRIEYGVYV